MSLAMSRRGNFWLSSYQ